MSSSSKINADAESEEQSRAEQTEGTSETVVTGDGGASNAATTSNQAEQGTDFEEFTLDDIEVIESKVFA